ncbi:MAG: polysaccharide pyruvyl transferase family protein [Desulfobacula sp.]|nr:polysaccharide pyruvyl transferase family protein [Desulfobacula sp.]
MINILMPEETPSLNKGESAILFGMLESFKALDQEINLTMFSFDPIIDENAYKDNVTIIDAKGIMPKCIMFQNNSVIGKLLGYSLFFIKHILFLSIFKVWGKNVGNIMKRDVWSQYLDAEVIIMAHDSAFAPVYHSFLAIFFKFLRKKVVVFGASFPPIMQRSGKLKRSFYNFIIKRAFDNIDLITLREPISMKYLNELKLSKTPVHLTADFAFLVRPAHEDRINEILDKENLIECEPIIGMTLSRNKVAFAYSSDEAYELKEKRFVEDMAKIVDGLIEAFNATIAFIPHSIVNDDKRDDRVLAQKVYDSSIRKEKIRLITDNYTSEELKGITSKFEFCIGTRLHFIVDAVSMLVPSFIITDKFDQRVHGIFGEMLGLDNSIYNIEDLHKGDLLPLIKDAWDKRKALKKKLADIIPAIEMNTM